ncbi:MAG: hypothetical protein ACTJLM_05135 [Ehrlichia sp.]
MLFFLYFVNGFLLILESVDFNSWSANRNSIPRADKTISTLINSKFLALSGDGILISCIRIARRNTLKYMIFAENAKQYLILCCKLLERYMSLNLLIN